MKVAMFGLNNEGPVDKETLVKNTTLLEPPYIIYESTISTPWRSIYKNSYRHWVIEVEGFGSDCFHNGLTS